MRGAWQWDDESDENEEVDDEVSGAGELDVDALEIERTEVNDGMGLSRPRLCVCDEARLFSSSTTVVKAKQWS